MLNSISEFYYSKFNSSEILTAGRRIDSTTNRWISSDPFVVKRIEGINNGIVTLEDAITTSPDAVSLLPWDKKRDDPWKAMGAYFDAMTLVTTISEYPIAGHFLSDIVNLAGRDAWRKPYAIQSAKTHLVLNKLDSKEAQAHIATIRAEPLVDAVRTSQADFEQAEQKLISKSALKKYPKAREAERSIVYNILALLSYIDASIEDDPISLSTLGKELSAEIDSLTAAANARENRKNGQEEEVVSEQA